MSQDVAHEGFRFLTIGFLAHDYDKRSAWLVTTNTPEDIGELITWIENWHCQAETQVTT